MNKTNISINSLQAILFDFDGVLCECMDVKTKAFAQLFKPFGEEVVTKVVKHHIENGGISRYKKIRYYYEEILKTQVSEEKVNYIAKIFSDLVVKKVIESEWVKGAKEFLDKYYKKIDFYVISGTPEDELNLIIKKREMEKYFKAIYGSPITKPDHARRIISERQYNPKKVLYIGDSISDCINAKEAKIPFLGRVTPGNENFFPKNILTISDFFEIEKVLK